MTCTRRPLALIMAYPSNAIMESLSKSAEQLGYSCLSAEQQEVVVNFVAGRDMFASLPTGAGKSLCYLVLPCIFNLLRNSKSSIVIVVCLLKSLIEYQIASLVPRLRTWGRGSEPRPQASLVPRLRTSSPGSEPGDEANQVANYYAHDFARDIYVIDPRFGLRATIDIVSLRGTGNACETPNAFTLQAANSLMRVRVTG